VKGDSPFQNCDDGDGSDIDGGGGGGGGNDTKLVTAGLQLLEYPVLVLARI
jgi:hypothetical protein